MNVDIQTLDFYVQIMDLSVKMLDFGRQPIDLDVENFNLDIKIMNLDVQILDLDVQIQDSGVQIQDFDVRVGGRRFQNNLMFCVYTYICVCCFNYSLKLNRIGVGSLVGRDVYELGLLGLSILVFWLTILVTLEDLPQAPEYGAGANECAF